MFTLTANPGLYVQTTEAPYTIAILVAGVAVFAVTVVVLAIGLWRQVRADALSPYWRETFRSKLWIVGVSVGFMMLIQLSSNSEQTAVEDAAAYQAKVADWLAAEHAITANFDATQIPTDGSVAQYVVRQDGKEVSIGIAASDDKILLFDGAGQPLESTR